MEGEAKHELAGQKWELFSFFKHRGHS